MRATRTAQSIALGLGWLTFIAGSRVKYEHASTSLTLERVICKQIEGIWIPMEGQKRRHDVFSNNDYDRLTNHVQITKLVLNPDHQALRSFVPDDIKNGAQVTIDPVLHQRIDPKQLPVWQDGRVVDKLGRVRFDCGLYQTDAAKPNSAGKK